MEIVLRAVIVYLILWLLLRIMGKRELSELTIAFLIVMTSMIGWRWKKTRPVLEGVPVVLMRDGETIDEALRLEHVTLEELKEAARQEGIGDLAHVEWCVLERDGRFSFPAAGERFELT